MADSEPVVTDEILSTVLYHIDLDNQACTSLATINEYSDLSGYLKDLLKEINIRDQRRSYEFARDSTEFFTSLVSFNVTKNLSINPCSQKIAERLLDKEIQTDAHYGHLSASGSGHVKKGSFLQFLFREGGKLCYLGVKIEHQSFLDEDDFRKKIGLSIENKIYKACKVTWVGEVPTSVLVFDTNSKPAIYWWREFLELKEVRDDSFNTRIASQEVVKILNSIKKEFPIDHTILRNATIAAFKQNGTMKFDVFIETTFGKYVPDNILLVDKLPSLIRNLNDLPEKKRFDTMFNLVPSEVSFNKKKVELTKEIYISFDEGINDLENKIWAEESASGQKLVVIDSPEGFSKFKLKVREA